MVKSVANDNLKKKSAKNASSGLIFFVLRTIVSFFLSPILIQYLGSNYFGIWKSLDKYLGFATVTDGGTQALKWTIANKESSQDFNEKRREIGSSLIVWLIFLPIVIIIVSLISYYSPFLINNIRQEDVFLIRLVALLLGLNIIITPLFGIPESVMIGVNKGFIVNFIKSIWIILGAFLIYYVLISDFGLEGLTIVTLVMTFLRGINYLITCQKRIEWFGIQMPRKHEIYFFLNFSSWKLLWAFLSRFILSSEILFIGYLFGTKMVSAYVFTSYISIIGINVAGIISSSLTPGLGKLIGNNEVGKTEKIINQLRELLIVLGLFVASCLILLNESFISIWVGSELFLGDASNLLISILMIQLIVIRNESYLIDLGLNIKKNVFIGIISAILSIILVYLGHKYIYENKLIIFYSIFISRLVMFISYPFFTNKRLNLPGKIKVSLKPLLYALIFIIAVVFVGQFQNLSSWFSLVLIGIAECLLAGFYLYYFVLGETNKKFIKSKLLILQARF